MSYLGLMIPQIVAGVVASVSVSQIDSALPITEITVATAHGDVVVVTPGANGQPPVVVGGVPRVLAGERWHFLVSETPRGLVPVDLGGAMARLDGPIPPPWAINGLVYPPEVLPMEMFISDPGSGALGLDATVAVVSRALDAWSSVACSDFEYVLAGVTDVGFEDDGLNVLSWEDEAWTWGAGVLGMAATRFELVDGLPAPSGADILFNGVDFLWVDGPGDLYGSPSTVSASSIVTHELGHVAGMDHNWSDVAATMFFAYVGGDWQGSLSGDDRRGLCETYGNGRDECAVDSDCAERDGDGLFRYCREIDGISVCDERRDSFGAFCSRTVFNCEELCLFTNSMATEGYCSRLCDTDDDCEAGAECGVPDGAFLYDDPAEDGERLCLRPEGFDTGAGSHTDGSDDDTGGAAVDSGELRSTPNNGEKPKAEGCGCTNSLPTAAPLLGFLMGLMALCLGRRQPPVEESR